MIDAVEKEAELEDVTDVLLVTRSDDFNALAAADLRAELGHGHVYRVAPDPEETELLPPLSEGGILGSRELTFAEISRRFAAGGRIVERRREEDGSRGADGDIPLFVVSSGGRLTVVVDGSPLEARPGDIVLALAQPAVGG